MNTKAKKEGSQGLVLKGEAESLIAKAIDRNVPVETMEKLLAMRRELQAEWAKRRFDEAMAAFQTECPIIEKTKRVDFVSKRTGMRTIYSYAPLEGIIRQVKGLLAKHGFSYTIDTQNSETRIVSVIKIRHVDSHTETTRFEVPIDKDSYMNAQQQYGSASTFSNRYAFCNAFGILTGDEDNDTTSIPPESHKTNVTNGKGIVTQKQSGFIKGLLVKKGHTEKELCLKYAVADMSRLTRTQASTIIENLQKLPDVDSDLEAEDARDAAAALS
jgi:hypothetical protein